MTATTAVMSGNGSVPAGDGLCGGPGAAGRSWPGNVAGPAGSAATTAAGGATLGKLTRLLVEASRLAVAVSAQLAEADPGRVAAVLAEAEAARRSAETHAATAAAEALTAGAQAAESAESAATAWEAADAARS